MANSDRVVYDNDTTLSKGKDSPLYEAWLNTPTSDSNDESKSKEPKTPEEKQTKQVEEAKKEKDSDGKKEKAPSTDLFTAFSESMISFAGFDAKKIQEYSDNWDKETTKVASNIFDSSEFKGGTLSKNMNGSFTQDALKGVFGLPYQFMSIADARYNGGSFGRKYYEKILTKMPLLVLTPGVPKFMRGASDAEKKATENLLTGILNGDAILDKISKDVPSDTRYYTLQFAAEEYYRYVNAMCRALIVYLNIPKDDNVVTDWKSYSRNNMGKAMGYYGGLAFYLNSETQVSESFNNDTSQSALAGKLNSLSDAGREVQFLTGIGGFSVDMFNQNNLAANGKNATKGAAESQTFTGFMNDLINGSKTIFAGGKLIFPELWADSSYSSSYSVNIKLVSPDNDVVSWYNNIGAPLMHLIALASPRQVDANGYVSPFLCRAWYKGFFNIDMGIMNMSVNKGAEGAWTFDGLPTVVDVSLDIKDLYSKFTISKDELFGGDAQALQNVALMTYLANMCGINMNVPDIARTLKLWSYLKYGSITDLPTNVYGRFSQSIAEVITNSVIGSSLK